MNICSVEGCDKDSTCRGFCNKHYRQFKNHGCIPKRIIYDPNEFIIDNNICWIILYNRNCIEVARAKIDLKYYEIIKNSKLKWHLLNNEYVISNWYYNGVQYMISLHEAIIQLSEQTVNSGEEIDHKDGDKLNCLEENLRVCKHSENSKNQKLHNNNTSGWKGVSWSKSNKKWKSQIRNNKNHIPLGVFNTKEEAARAYNAAAIKYFGEFARLNEV